MNKIVLIVVLFLAAAMFGGCGRGDAEKSAVRPQEPRQQVSEVDAKAEVGAVPESRSSRNVVERLLAEKGIRQGVDVAKGRILAVETRGFPLKGEERDETCELTETYDFLDDESDDFETKRFKTVWKAYADGLATIAQMVATQMNEENVKGAMGNGGERKSVQSAAELGLHGVVTVTSAELLNAENGEYEFTVAVCQSQKRQELYKNSLIGNQTGRPGRYSLKEWVDENSSTGIICPQSLIDNEGVWWRVAGVPVEIGRNGKPSAMTMGRAKHYAFEAANRTIAVKVASTTSHTSIRRTIGDESHTDERIERTVMITPLSNVSPSDLAQVKWFELTKTSITGKHVRMIVCAIREDAGNANVARNAEDYSHSREISSAVDQAEKFCRDNKLMLGFDENRKVAARIAYDNFEYLKTMRDEEFALRRCLATQRALMTAAVQIAYQIGQEFDTPKGQYRHKHDLSSLGSLVNDEDDEYWISRLMGRKFAWVARLENSMGSMEFSLPLLGLSVVRQFESLIDDEYQVALIVSLDVERGSKKVLSFMDGGREVPGKMPLWQWMDVQDFGLIAGPRLYVDNEGAIWALGIVPATEGQQPYGFLLDSAARDCAAFALGGDIAVSVKESVGSIEFKANGAGDWYPRELELFFRRPYTNPVTGRKGVVSICALRSGASKAMKEIYARKIKETQEKQYEMGMRAGMLDRVKRLTAELRKVYGGPVDPSLKRRVKAIEAELSRLEEELQDKRRMRPARRKHFTDKIIEIESQIIKLKGGKNDEE